MIMIVVMFDMHDIWCCQMKLSSLRKLSPTFLPWLAIRHNFFIVKNITIVYFQAFTVYFSNAAESMLLFSAAQICKFSEHAFVTLCICSLNLLLTWLHLLSSLVLHSLTKSL